MYNLKFANIYNVQNLVTERLNAIQKFLISISIVFIAQAMKINIIRIWCRLRLYFNDGDMYNDQSINVKGFVSKRHSSIGVDFLYMCC